MQTGRLKARAVTRLKRTSLLPDVPTVDEQGLKGFDINSWVVLMAAGGTPPAIIERLNLETRKVLQMPEVKTVLENQGMEAPGKSLSTFAPMFASSRLFSRTRN